MRQESLSPFPSSLCVLRRLFCLQSTHLECIIRYHSSRLLYYIHWHQWRRAYMHAASLVDRIKGRRPLESCATTLLNVDLSSAHSFNTPNPYWSLQNAFLPSFLRRYPISEAACVRACVCACVRARALLTPAKTRLKS